MKHTSHARLVAAFLAGLVLGGCGRPLTTDQAASIWKEKNHAGLASLQKGDYGQSEQELQAALAAARTIGPDSLQTAVTLNNLASLYEQQSRVADAVSAYEQALSIFNRQPQGNAAAMAVILSNLGHLQSAAGQADEAAAAYRRAVALRDELPGADKQDLADDLFALAEIYVRQERLAFAEPLYRRALAIEVGSRGRADPKTVMHAEAYARLLRSMHRLSDALAVEKSLEAVKDGQGDSAGAR